MGDTEVEEGLGEDVVFFQGIEEQMADLVDTPEAFLTPSVDLEERLLGVTKQLFDFAKQQEPVELGPLPELLIEGFAPDQIWEEIQLQNQPMWNYLNKSITKLQDKEIAFFTVSKKKARQMDTTQEDEDEDEEAEEEDKEEEVDEESEDTNEKNSRGQNGDRFFNMDEMDEFLDQAELEEELKKDKEKQNNEEDEDEDEEADDDDEEARLEKVAKRKMWEDPEEEDRMLFPDVENQRIDEDASKEAIEARRKALIDKMRSMSGGDMGASDEVRYEQFFDPPKQRKRGKKPKNEDDDSSYLRKQADDQDEGEDSVEDASKKNKKRKAAKGGDDSGKGKKRKTSDSEEEEDEEDEGEEEEEDEGEEDKEDEKDKKPKESVFEIRSKRMAEKIKKLEETNVAPKPWMLSGEVNAYNRPINSLLETYVDFESSYKPKPIITAEVTQSLEDVIKQRIREESWDDVIRKYEQEKKAKKELPELNFEKNKEGLAAEYEKLYMEKAAPKTDVEMSAQQKEIQAMFRSLCYKLDSLSNFHFTPKPPREEIFERPNVPALQMEEIIPIGISDANLLAPEEIFEPKKDVKAPTEMSREERKTQRSTKKRKRNKARKQKDAEFKQQLRVNPELADAQKKSIKGAMETIKKQKNVLVADRKKGTSATTSTQLFTQLTQEQQKGPGGAKKEKKKKQSESAKFKL